MLRSRLGLLAVTIVVVLALVQLGGPVRAVPGASAAAAPAQVPAPRTVEYYIAADEVEWDYAPSGLDQITGQPFTPEANVFVENGPHRIGHKYVKALYREYTDATFTTLKPRPAAWQHLGFLGPLVRAEVGDAIKVHFKNNATFPGSMHPHGVFYDKRSEGAPYNDGTSGADKADDGVPTGGTVDYTWLVPERAGPGPMDGNSVMWMYHSHVDEPKDLNSGLVGPMIITARGQSQADGRPRGIDREFILNFEVIDENDSWLLDRNIQTYTSDPGGVVPEDGEFEESNLMHSMNGYVYGNLPMMTMKKGEHVRWYVMDMGTEVDLHTPHWHGNTVLWMGQRTDVVQVLPAGMLIADMVPDNPGIWLFHCHVNDHIKAGMLGRYQVLNN